MKHSICDACETVKLCTEKGCRPVVNEQPTKPMQDPGPKPFPRASLNLGRDWRPTRILE